jgi:hypothetical protein
MKRSSLLVGSFLAGEVNYFGRRKSPFVQVEQCNEDATNARFVVCAALHAESATMTVGGAQP